MGYYISHPLVSATIHKTTEDNDFLVQKSVRMQEKHRNIDAPSLDDFIHSFRGGPACLLDHDGCTGSDFALRTANSLFTTRHRTSLQRQASGIGFDSDCRIDDVNWRFTSLDRKRYTVCLGTADTHSQGQRSLLPDFPLRDEMAMAIDDLPSTSQAAEGGNMPTQANGKESSASATWFANWKSLEVPGLEACDAHAHLDLIRSIDWTKTSLGPIDTWGELLLSTISLCLASSFPVLLLWGPDMISGDLPNTWCAHLVKSVSSVLYNHPYSRNISEKHPRILGMAYKDGWPEGKQYSNAKPMCKLSIPCQYGTLSNRFRRRLSPESHHISTMLKCSYPLADIWRNATLRIR